MNLAENLAENFFLVGYISYLIHSRFLAVFLLLLQLIDDGVHQYLSEPRLKGFPRIVLLNILEDL